MNYKQRRQLIQQLVEENHIATQEELLELLKQHGVVATQATVSRDIHSLNIAKVSSSDGQSYYAQVRPPRRTTTGSTGQLPTGWSLTPPLSLLTSLKPPRTRVMRPSSAGCLMNCRCQR